MLTEITIENLAIIDRVSLRLDRGLNVLTGETGAGKSIIIDAVQAVLGSRCSPEMVRAGANRAVVEALFDCIPAAVLNTLESLGMDASSELVLTREILSNGRSIARINGRLATTAMLKEIARHLVDIHGQGEHQLLLDSSRHIDLLDAFIGEEAQRERGLVASLYHQLESIRQQLRSLSDSKERARVIDLLTYQINEIEQARLNVGEEDALLEERKILASAQRLIDAVSNAYGLVYEGHRNNLSALDSLNRALSWLSEAAQVDARLKPAVEALNQAAVWIDEGADELRRYRDTLRPDPERLNWVEERLSFINQMKRKYGDTVEDILKWHAEARHQLEELTHADEKATELSRQEELIRQRLGEACLRLSTRRHEAAARIASLVSSELADLGMKNTRFEVNLGNTLDPKGLSLEGKTVRVTPLGIDTVEFMLSPNPGEPLRPLSRIASGGETSRIMLALKSVLARAEAIPTLIFDEVDAGVGGQTGYTLGEKLSLLARSSQVLCVTHLAQIASFADRHIVVHKSTIGQRTSTSVSIVDGDDRVREIARMIGGPESAVSIAHAKEMLRLAQATKTGRQGW